MAASGMIGPSHSSCVSAGLVMLQVGRFLPGWQQRPEPVKDSRASLKVLVLQASSERKNLQPLLT